jgi:hypothetical protein
MFKKMIMSAALLSAMVISGCSVSRTDLSNLTDQQFSQLVTIQGNKYQTTANIGFRVYIAAIEDKQDREDAARLAHNVAIKIHSALMHEEITTSEIRAAVTDIVQKSNINRKDAVLLLVDLIDLSVSDYKNSLDGLLYMDRGNTLIKNVVLASTQGIIDATKLVLNQ